tara:strand:+ start:1059 stop:1394 length:336 start_codon:yes stop_codon:yes gene_type:complete
MYAILLIVLIIVLLEIYNLIPERNSEKIPENDNENIDENDVKFNEYLVKTDTNVLHYAGKILIKENNNIILKYNDESILMEKGIIYNLKDNFEIEIINIDNNDIYYYYISS